MASVSCPLLDTPSLDTREAITAAYWGPIAYQPSSISDGDPFEAYWVFYAQECERALHDGGRHVLARTHQDLLDIVVLLKEHRTRDEIGDFLRCKLTKAHSNEDELVNGAIDLAASLLLMIDFRSLQYGFSGRQLLAWDKASVKECVESHFGAAPVLGHEGVKLQRVFNAVNLERIAGVEMVPTNNLADHLRLTDDDTKLCVFHNASFLKQQRHSTVLPDGLAEETLRTLALLFPQSDPSTRIWFRRISSSRTSEWLSRRPIHLLDQRLIQCGHLKTDDRQIENFTYWHDRLVVLKQVFDEATPRTITQWWQDRRNGVQWYTFWVAILVLGLTLSFGLIQSIEGALQVYGTFADGKGE